MTSDGTDRDEILRAFGFVSGIGLFFAACLAAGLGLGLLIAHVVGGGALVILLGLLIGAVAGGRGVYRMVMRDVSNT